MHHGEPCAIAMGIASTLMGLLSLWRMITIEMPQFVLPWSLETGLKTYMSWWATIKFPYAIGDPRLNLVGIISLRMHENVGWNYCKVCCHHLGFFQRKQLDSKLAICYTIFGRRQLVNNAVHSRFEEWKHKQTQSGELPHGCIGGGESWDR